MANFATFQNHVIFFNIIFLVVFPIEHLLFGVIFVHYFLSWKFSLKVGHFLRSCLTITFAKWPILPIFKIVSFFENLMVFEPFSPYNISYVCLESFLYDF